MEEKRASERMQHVQELRRQVRENQQKLVQDRIATFEEGQRLKEEAQRRSERINDVKKKKIEELRYCSRSSSGPREAEGPESWDSAIAGRGRGGQGCCRLQGAPAEYPAAWVFPAPWGLPGRMLGL